MKDIMIFKRVEKKYRLDPAKKAELLQELLPHLTPDAHGRNTIVSLYLDTPDHRIIRASIDAKAYKEKLRLRAYGTPDSEETVFLEIKKKYKGVVYKRRIAAPLAQAMDYLNGGERPEESQIMNEIDYAMHFWQQPRPAMLVAYEREAYFAPEEPNLRITFDMNARFRRDDLDLTHGPHGTLILPEDAIILEIKTDGVMPLWLTRALDHCGLLPSSFSKYGAAYLSELPRSTPSAPTHTTQGGTLSHA